MSDASEPVEEKPAIQLPAAATVTNVVDSGREPERDAGRAPDTVPTQDMPQWEYCEIVYHPGPGLAWYEAQASGSAFPYRAGVSRTVIAPTSNEDPARKHGPAVEELILRLRHEGWEALDIHGSWWFSYRLRRLASLRPSNPQQLGRKASPSIPPAALGAAASKALTDAAPHARAWTIQHVAGGNEEAYDKAVDAVKHAARAVTDAATAALATHATPETTTNPSVIQLGPASDTDPTVHVDQSASTTVVIESQPPSPSLSAPSTDSPADTIAAVIRPAEAPAETVSAHQQQPSVSVGAGLRAGARVLAADHAGHLAHRRANQDKGYLDRSEGRRVRRYYTFVVRPVYWSVIRPLLTDFTILVEMKPDIYGPGDVITFVEASFGRTIDGLRLSLIERLIYFGASITPFVPARPVVGIYRRVEPWLRGDTRAGWAFLQTQFPPWLRHSLPDPFDPRSPYPRPGFVRAIREVVSFVWLPIVVYLGILVAKLAGQVWSISWQVVWNHDLGKLGALLDPNLINTALLLNDLRAVAPDVPLMPWVPIGGFLLIVCLLTIATIARHDWLRETVAVNIREHLPKAHDAVVDNVGATLRAQGDPVADKLAQSFQHLHEHSLKTARSIATILLGKEFRHLAIAAGLALVAFVVGVALALVGVV